MRKMREIAKICLIVENTGLDPLCWGRRLSLLWTGEAGGRVYSSGTDSEGKKHETCCTTATSAKLHTTECL